MHLEFLLWQDLRICCEESFRLNISYNLCYRYDSTHVGLHRDKNVSVTSTDDGKLCINENQIMVFAEKDPKLIPWSLAGKQLTV